MENSNSSLKVIGTLALGAIAGAALGILFAPDKGSRTRQKLMNGASDITDDIKSRMKQEANALRKKADDLETLAAEKVNDITNNVKHKAEAHKN